MGVTPIRVLFVCLGNICRSPMADGYFRHLVAEEGLADQIVVDSAGTAGYHIGELADPRTRQTLQAHGIAYEGRARQLSSDDLDAFDYLLAMDTSNLRNMQRLNGPKPNLHLFLSFANRAGLTEDTEVPDPYYDGSFDRTYRLVALGSRALLDYIRTERGL